MLTHIISIEMKIKIWGRGSNDCCVFKFNLILGKWEDNHQTVSTEKNVVYVTEAEIKGFV